MTALESARALADAVLYEGYVLYPYRASAEKNQVRWQWGVLMPEDVAAVDASERSGCVTEVVVDGAEPRLRATVRFLQVQHRRVEQAAPEGFAQVDRLDVGDASYTAWDEARERQIVLDVPLRPTTETTVDVAGGTSTEVLPDDSGQPAGRLVRSWEPLRVGVIAEVHRPVSPYPVSVVTLRVENRTPPVGPPGTDRADWLRRALVACHVLLEAGGARFVSLLDPPEWARGLVERCANDGVFPVLAGPAGQQGVVLSSPIILYDHAEVAPESASSFFDALEVDELLSLRTLTLTEAERREVRGTDPRASALLGDVDGMPAELWERLHGTIRYVEAATARAEPAADVPDVPWWDPGADDSVDPEHDCIRIRDVEVCRGSRVVLRPGVRRADAYDLFLAGRTATVAAVLHDVDEGRHLAVTLDDDPSGDLMAAHGRYLYFAPDEVEPLAAPVDGGA